MKRILLLCCFAVFTPMVVGCGGHEEKIVEQPASFEKSETEKEMETEDYEKAMKEMANQ